MIEELLTRYTRGDITATEVMRLTQAERTRRHYNTRPAVPVWSPVAPSRGNGTEGKEL